jgi:glycine cleavage system H lipoate-binding protein
MMPHDILTLDATKAVEYLIAVAFLLLFVPFWQYAMRTVPTESYAAARVAAFADLVSGWFRVPDDTFFHPGHAWARVEADGLVTVGADDFAQKLVGPVRGVQLPPPGTRLEPGRPAWRLEADSKAVDMLAPVGGEVVAVNPRALEAPETVNRDPYGEGWLIRLRSPRLGAHLAQLKAGEAARRWMSEVCDELCASMSPALGLVYQDGGLPVDGLARALAGDRWDELASRFLLTAPPAPEREAEDDAETDAPAASGHDTSGRSRPYTM